MERTISRYRWFKPKRVREMIRGYEEDDARCKYLHDQPCKSSVDEKFRLILRLLRQDFPPEYPVKVHRVTKPLTGPDAPYGDCSLVNQNGLKDKRYFLIRISKTIIWTQQFETILHEWAHCLTWHLVDGSRAHSDVFHRKYGVLYRKYIED